LLLLVGSSSSSVCPPAVFFLGEKGLFVGAAEGVQDADCYVNVKSELKLNHI
jgi:hypothetical protein